MGKVIGRFFKSEDITGIVKLYNFITGRSRTVEQHSWEWIQNPFRSPDIWILEDDESHEIIGHHGLIPLPMTWKEQNFSAGKTENTIIHPRLSGTGLYFIHEQKFFKNIKSKYDILFTTSGHGTPGKIRKQLGYFSLSEYSRFVTLKNPSGFPKLINYYVGKRKMNIITRVFTKIFLTMAMYILSMVMFRFNGVSSNRKFKNFSKMSESLAKDLDKFWNENRTYFGFTIDRNSAYLQWRIFDNPNINYEMIAMYSKYDEFLGYSIVAKDELKLPKGVVIDIVAVKRDPKIFKELISQTIHSFNEQRISYIEFPTLKVDNDLQKVFKRMGFFDLGQYSKKQSTLMVYVNDSLKDEALNDPQKWYYTSLFTEGYVL